MGSPDSPGSPSTPGAPTGALSGEMKPKPKPSPVTVALPSMGPPEGTPLMAWLAIGTGTMLSVLLGAWTVKKLADDAANEAAGVERPQRTRR